jgi:cyclophilin family peptidyl-prolyl cis-trans isomerase
MPTTPLAAGAGNALAGLVLSLALAATPAAFAGTGSATAAGQPAEQAAEPPAVAVPPVEVRLEPERAFHGVGRSIDLRLDVRRPPLPAATTPEGEAALEQVRQRLQPNTREQLAARDRDRQAAEAAIAAMPLPEVRLLLVDGGGTILAETAPVAAGRLDLAVLVPEVWSIRSVFWVQPVTDEGPTGTPLVMQPMLGREVPVPEEAVSPSGIRYARIRGWVGEDEAWDAIGAARRGEPWPPPVEDAAAEGDAAEPTSARPEPGRTFTGFLAYSDARVVMDTEYGELEIELRPDAAPNTARNFRELAAGGFYRETVFHRVVPLTPAGDPFVIQGGDPSGEGSGGPGWWLPMERSTLPHEFGVVSMARDTHPDSAGSQFFICLSRAGTARLDGSYTAFGQVVRGGDVVRRIAQVPLADASTGRPRQPPLLRDAWLVPAPPRSLGSPVAAPPPTPEPARPTRVPR